MERAGRRAHLSEPTVASLSNLPATKSPLPPPKVGQFYNSFNSLSVSAAGFLACGAGSWSCRFACSTGARSAWPPHRRRAHILNHNHWLSAPMASNERHCFRGPNLLHRKLPLRSKAGQANGVGRPLCVTGFTRTFQLWPKVAPKVVENFFRFWPSWLPGKTRAEFSSATRR